MSDMTDEEYDALDERLTKDTPEFTPKGKMFSTYEGSQFVFLDDDTANYIKSKALASGQLPGEVIASIVRKELATQR